MNILSWLFKKRDNGSSSTLSQGAQDFLDGKKNTLTSADIDPEGTELFEGFQKAMVLKKEGKFAQAEKILINSCEPPSTYKGHYRELFKIWRQYNRDDIKAEKYHEVSERVLKMLRLDDEMIKEMLRYWSIQQRRELPQDYFNADRNLRVSDAKALRKTAEALKNNENLALAESLIKRFAKK